MTSEWTYSAALEFEHRNPNPGRCAIGSCPRKGKNLMICGRCEKRYYCCQAHQKQDWPIHKQFCRVYADPPLRLPYMTVEAPLSLAQRMRFGKMFVESLLSTVTTGTLPQANMEGVWGLECNSNLPRGGHVGMDHPTGSLVFHAWRSIFTLTKKEKTVQFKADLTAALLAGGVPAYLRKKAEALWGKCPYCSELNRRSFRGISWDRGMLNVFAGKLNSGNRCSIGTVALTT